MRAADAQGIAPAAQPSAVAIRAEIVPLAAMADILADWSSLCERTLEGNIFLEPGFAVPLYATGAARSRPSVLLAWAADGTGGRDRLVGLLPVRIPRFTRGLAIGVRDPMLTCGTPLLDRDCAGEAFASMMRRLAADPSRPAALLLTNVTAEGPFAGLLADGRSGGAPGEWPVTVLADYRRAVLRRAGGNVLSLASAKTRKERKRQRRRLCEQGERAYVSARTPEAVKRATERFLALERKGWKGVRGTALLADDRLAAFTRAMTAALAAEGKCRIDALEMDGEAIAMGIVLTRGGHAHFWKTAYDEALASLSPGVQFAIDLAEAQLGDDTVALTDSCAIPDHPMIDRLWPDRLGVVDLAVGLGPRRAVALAVAGERLRRRLRAVVKTGANALRRRLRR